MTPDPARTRDRGGWAGWLALGGLLAFVALGVAACIIEGCTVDHVRRGVDTIEFRLDAAQPVLVSQATIEISPESFPVEQPGALRVTSTLAAAEGLSVVLVRTSTGEPIPTIDRTGVTELAVGWCQTGQPCLIDLTAIVRWIAPEPDRAIEATWTLAAAIAYPYGEARCGPPVGAELAVHASEAQPIDAPPVSTLAGDDAVYEASRHVSVQLDEAGPGASPPADVVATAQLVVSRRSDLDGAQPGAILGLWLRVTPDDGGPPLVDGPVPTPYGSPMTATATFPILAACPDEGRCRRGYWIQLLVHDPTGFNDERMPPVSWEVRAALLPPSPMDGGAAVRRLQLALDDAAPSPPAPLLLEGTGEPFDIAPGREQTSVVFRIGVPPRSLPVGLADPARSVTGVVFLRATRDANDDGEIWIANGHWVGDGIDDPRAAESGGWGGNPGSEHPGVVGQPLLGCVDRIDPCTARSGYVVSRYTSTIGSERNAERFGVEWRWRLVGAPPGATVVVEAVDGVAFEAAPGLGLPAHVVVAIVMASAAVAFVVIVVIQRRRSFARPPDQRR